MKSFDAASAVDKLLLASIEGMAFVADVDMCALDCGLCFNYIAAGTRKRNRLVFRMDLFFHNNLQSGKRTELDFAKYTVAHEPVNKFVRV